MGAIRTLKDAGSNYLITSNVDGAVYSLICADCIIGGMGDMFDITYKTSSLYISFAKGSQAVIGGNAFWLEDAVDITLPTNSTIYLCLRVDPTKPNGQTGSIECLTESAMQKGNPNTGGVRDFAIYSITTNSSGISNIVDSRKILYAGEATVTKKDFNDDVKNLKSMYDFLNNIVKSLQSDIQNLNTALNEEIAKSNNNVKSLNTALSNLTDRVAALENK